MKKLFASALILTVALAFTGCHENKEKITFSDNTELIDRYLPGIKEYSGTEYESRIFVSTTFGIEGLFDIGPHEPRYSGVVYLDEDDAKVLAESYEWVETTKPDISFSEVDYVIPDDCTWYRSDEFNKEGVGLINPVTVAFNGEVVIFVLQVT